MWFLGFQVLLLLTSQVPKINAAPSVSATFSNAIQYQFDTDGNAIDLTSGRVDYLGGSYIWYGLTFGTYWGSTFLAIPGCLKRRYSGDIIAFDFLVCS
jgi:hypothetical protein